jgi:hypothetical protein
MLVMVQHMSNANSPKLCRTLIRLEPDTFKVLDEVYAGL